MDLVWLFTPRLEDAETKKVANLWGQLPWIVTQLIDERNVIIVGNLPEYI